VIGAARPRRIFIDTKPGSFRRLPPTCGARTRTFHVPATFAFDITSMIVTMVTGPAGACACATPAVPMSVAMAMQIASKSFDMFSSPLSTNESA
jgi:hypothetical protein